MPEGCHSSLLPLCLPLFQLPLTPWVLSCSGKTCFPTLISPTDGLTVLLHVPDLGQDIKQADEGCSDSPMLSALQLSSLERGWETKRQIQPRLQKDPSAGAMHLPSKDPRLLTEPLSCSKHSCFVLMGLGSLLPHLAPSSSLPMWDDRGTPRGWRGTSRLPVSRCIIQHHSFTLGKFSLSQQLDLVCSFSNISTASLRDTSTHHKCYIFHSFNCL